MQKLTSLRQHLLDSVPGLAADPDRLRTYVPEGNIAFSRGLNLSHEYRVTAEIIIIGTDGDLDPIVLPILQWLGRYQPDVDPAQALRFSAEIHNHTEVDVIFSVELTERVVALVDCATRQIRSEHRMPKYPLDACPAEHWQLLVRSDPNADYTLAAEWQSP
ncbi:MAG: phage tail protein [Salinicola sp.]|uniref:phage tail protein n=1 Tax=uncultured Salinicola sp. TaxID=1193542 RepID=UPI000C946102|nr:phage tail protein [uncultured Salinicola sp.]MAM57370.1 phage tail protein [Salinicola sp.]